MDKQKHDEKHGDASLSGHDYDGIEEFDNPLPAWWQATFYGAIVFALGYFSYYMLGAGPSLVDEFETERTRLETANIALRAKIKHPDEVQFANFLKDPVRKTTGMGIFHSRCASCHGPQGQGLIGPNLTDNYWIHGTGKMTEIVKTVYDGVPDKGMPSWGMMMSPEEVYAAVVYVRSLQGTQPPNPKAPQGNLIK